VHLTLVAPREQLHPMPDSMRSCSTSLWGAYNHPFAVLVTTDMHVRHFRQPRSGPLKVEARLVHKGRRLLSSECVVVDSQDRVLARSTATYMLVPMQLQGDPGRPDDPSRWPWQDEQGRHLLPSPCRPPRR